MKITAQIHGTERTLDVQVVESTLVDDLKGILEMEAGIPSAMQLLIHKGRYIHENGAQTMKQLGIKAGDNIVVAHSNIFYENPQQALLLQAEMQIQYYNHNHMLLDELLQSNRELGEAIVTHDVDYVANYLLAQQQQHVLKERQKQEEMQRIEADPLDPANQQKIESLIQQKRINENLEYAEEQMPESFIKVPMLYIDCSVNSVPMHAFVDTGAQSTIMSKGCAQKNGLINLMDVRFKGVAVGVGKGTILGKVHAAQLEIGGKYFPCSFTIMDSDTLNVDLILGLDNLRKHRCCIDLANNQLRLMNGETIVPFLQEHKVMEAFHTESAAGSLPHEEQKQPAPVPASSSLAFVPNPNPHSNLGPRSQPQPQPHPPSPPRPAPSASASGTVPVPALAPANPPGPSAGAGRQTVKEEKKSGKKMAVKVAGKASKYSEQNIQRLMQEGVTREYAIAVLDQYRGNMDMALSYIIQERNGL